MGAVAVVRVLGPIPDRWAALGIAVTGLAWSLGTFAANWPLVKATELPVLQAVALTMVGGVAAALAVWFGIGAVTWAMVRALRGQVGFVRMLLTVSAATPPVWLAAPAIALLLAGNAGIGVTVSLAAIAVAGSLLFAAWVAAGIHRAAALSQRRAWACVLLAAIFIVSFLSLQI